MIKLRKVKNPATIVANNKTRIFDYSLHRKRNKKHALLSYLAQPVISEMQGEYINRFSNHGLAVSWAHTLSKLGYLVDIVDWDDTDFRPTKSYDLVVVHGAKNFTNIYKKLTNKPPLIHFLTGTYWRFNNTEEDKRIKEFKRRNGASVSRDRYITHSEDEVNEAADGIVILGNESVKKTYSDYPHVYNLNIGVYPDNHFNDYKKDYKAARNNFLFYSGAGNIHKGLDLLIEAFENTDLDLFIVSNLDEKVIDVYKNVLEKSNFHVIGPVNMRTKEFYDIVESCGFVILPSCSEGQSGGVVEAMQEGLVPIVPKISGLDVEGYGIELQKSTIAEIERVCIRSSKMSAGNLEAMSKRVRKVAQKNHSPKQFSENLEKVIRNILRQK
jgi:glycosyltransferase involved in cell wall biosynthesis